MIEEGEKRPTFKMDVQCSELSSWQKRGIDLTDSLCQDDGATYFTLYPTFVVTNTNHTRVHEVSQASRQIDAMNHSRALIAGMYLIGPGKKVIAECTDKLFDAIQGSTASRKMKMLRSYGQWLLLALWITSPSNASPMSTKLELRALVR